MTANRAIRPPPSAATIPSAFFTGVGTMLTAMLVGLALFRRDLLKGLLVRRSDWLKLGLTAAVLAARAWAGILAGAGPRRGRRRRPAADGG